MGFIKFSMLIDSKHFSQISSDFPKCNGMCTVNNFLFHDARQMNKLYFVFAVCVSWEIILLNDDNVMLNLTDKLQGQLLNIFINKRKKWHFRN